MAQATAKTAKTDEVEKALAAGTENPIKPGMSLQSLLKTDTVKRRFEDVLKNKAAGFMSSIMSAVSSNRALSACDPMSVISAAAVAASLDLPINPSLGFAHIVPYKDVAQFQMGWRGFVQLAMRTGQYRTMNVSEVYEGQLKSQDPFTGLFEFDPDGKKSDKVIGYVAYYRLLNGFEKYLYMTTEAAEAHGKKYSKSYDNDRGQWKLNFPAMAKKTVIKALLSKWGILSVEMQKAIESDQAAIDESGKPTYIDRASVQDGEVVPESEVPAEAAQS